MSSTDEFYNFVSGRGRLVQGSVHKPRTTDNKGNPLVIKHGPRAGQPREDFFFAVAFRKGDPEAEQFVQGLRGYAEAQFPGRRADQLSTKIVDGDGVDENGNPNADKPGQAGHWVVRFNSNRAPETYTDGGARSYAADQIKRGDYVKVAGYARSNGASGSQSGIYVNHTMVCFEESGEAISSRPDAASVFGGTVSASSAFGGPKAPAPTPNREFVEGAAPPPPAAPAPGPRLTSKAAKGCTIQSYLDAGWTMAQLVQKGIVEE